jgi:hypothetical protein
MTTKYTSLVTRVAAKVEFLMDKKARKSFSQGTFDDLTGMKENDFTDMVRSVLRNPNGTVYYLSGQGFEGFVTQSELAELKEEYEQKRKQYVIENDCCEEEAEEEIDVEYDWGFFPIPAEITQFILK